MALSWSLAARSLIFSAALMGILGAHEMGHYLACRYYDVDATLPFFLPFPLLSIFGTLGAVIKIREPFPTRRALFDIGVAGPIAGFAVLVPLLFFAVWDSSLVQAPPVTRGWSFGEPLLFRMVVWLRFGPIPDGHQLNLHPVGFAAMFGMLATAWNLLPFGQFDGGHLAHAALTDRSRYLSYFSVVATIGLSFMSISWIVLTVMMVAMLYFLGPRHPRALNEWEPIGAWRYAILAFAVVMFVLCVTPVPLERIGN